MKYEFSPTQLEHARHLSSPEHQQEAIECANRRADREREIHAEIALQNIAALTNFNLTQCHT